jgi:chromosome partitioning protein
MSIDMEVDSDQKIETSEVISFFTHKGGVGKTSMVLNISRVLASGDPRVLRKNNRILIIDADPQMSLTTFILSPDEFEAHITSESTLVKNQNDPYSLMGYYWGKKNVTPYHYVHGDSKNSSVDVLLGSFEDTKMETQLSVEIAQQDFGMYLRKFINKLNYLRTKYDMILIDLSPSMNSINSVLLLLSDKVVSPVTPDVFCRVSFKLYNRNLIERFKQTIFETMLPKFQGYILNRVKIINGKLTRMFIKFDNDFMIENDNDQSKRLGFVSNFNELGLRLSDLRQTLVDFIHHRSGQRFPKAEIPNNIDLNNAYKYYHQILDITNTIFNNDDI